MSFKIGDKVKRRKGSVGVISVVTWVAKEFGSGYFYTDQDDDLCHQDYWVLAEDVAVVPHPHAALIKQWADGAKIEWRGPHNGEWVEVETPGWYDYHEYRIKPETKPDIVREVNCVHTDQNVSQVGISIYNPCNLKLTFDGETGKLKAAEVI